MWSFSVSLGDLLGFMLVGTLVYWHHRKINQRVVAGDMELRVNAVEHRLAVVERFQIAILDKHGDPIE